MQSCCPIFGTTVHCLGASSSGAGDLELPRTVSKLAYQREYLVVLTDGVTRIELLGRSRRQHTAAVFGAQRVEIVKLEAPFDGVWWNPVDRPDTELVLSLERATRFQHTIADLLAKATGTPGVRR